MHGLLCFVFVSGTFLSLSPVRSLLVGTGAVFVYTLLGGVVFAHLENWDYFRGAYFSVQTITTSACAGLFIVHMLSVSLTATIDGCFCGLRLLFVVCLISNVVLVCLCPSVSRVGGHSSLHRRRSCLLLHVRFWRFNVNFSDLFRLVHLSFSCLHWLVHTSCDLFARELMSLFFLFRFALFGIGGVFLLVNLFSKIVLQSVRGMLLPL